MFLIRKKLYELVSRKGVSGVRRIIQVKIYLISSLNIRRRWGGGRGVTRPTRYRRDDTYKVSLFSLSYQEITSLS